MHKYVHVYVFIGWQYIFQFSVSVYAFPGSFRRIKKQGHSLGTPIVQILISKNIHLQKDSKGK